METQKENNKKKEDSLLNMTQKEELKHRIEATKKLLEAKKSELKADAMNHFRDEKKRIDDEIKNIQKLIADGWDKATESTAKKINQWIKEVSSNN